MKKLLLISLTLLSFIFAGCSKKTNGKSIAVFVPGIIDGSPTYEKLARGVTNAVNEYNQSADEKNQVNLFIMEAGTNQAEWSSKITALAAEAKYDLIISSNPSLPDLVEPVIKQFPSQKFILLDATREGNQNIHTVCYDQAQQGYLAGFIGGLMTKTGKLALISAQEYPVMNEIIFPSFEKGAKAAKANASVDFRIVGNWYDATKGAEIADALAKNNVDVILPVCGGASQGVISSAVNNKIYISWFDDSGFKRAPGTIIGSSVTLQDKMAEIVTKDYLAGKTPWGTAKMVGMQEGFIKFIQDDPLYEATVPAEKRKVMAEIIEKLSNGSLKIN